MNRIARNLIIALPLSAAALTMSTGAASAETPAPTPGPVIVLPAEPVEPPQDFGNPAPVPPKEIANPTPAPQPDPGPQLPDDKAPVPQDEPNPAPEAPGEITDVPDCTHGCDGDDTPDDKAGPHDGEDEFDFPLDGGCFEDCDLPEEETTPEDTEVATFRTFTTPTRVDAGLGEHDDNGLQLTWLLASGALVTVGGATLVARKRAQA